MFLFISDVNKKQAQNIKIVNKKIFATFFLEKLPGFFGGRKRQGRNI